MTRRSSARCNSRSFRDKFGRARDFQPRSRGSRAILDSGASFEQAGSASADRPTDRPRLSIAANREAKSGFAVQTLFRAHRPPQCSPNHPRTAAVEKKSAPHTPPAGVPNRGGGVFLLVDSSSFLCLARYRGSPASGCLRLVRRLAISSKPRE